MNRSMMKIGTSRKNATELELLTVEMLDTDMMYYFTIFKMGRSTFNLLVETSTFYSFLSRGKDAEKVIRSITGESVFEVGIIRDASLRSNVQAIVSKAKSLGYKSDKDIEQIQGVLNRIPWKFLGSSSPAELREGST